MTRDSHLGCEASHLRCWIIFAVATMSDRHVLDTQVHTPQEELHSKLLLCTWTKATTPLGLRTPISSQPTGLVPMHQLCGCAGGVDTRAYQLDELRAACFHCTATSTRCFPSLLAAEGSVEPILLIPPVSGVTPVCKPEGLRREGSAHAWRQKQQQPGQHGQPEMRLWSCFQ